MGTKNEGNILFEVETNVNEQCWREIYWSTVSFHDKMLQTVSGIIFWIGLVTITVGVVRLLSIPECLGIYIPIALIFAIITFALYYYGLPRRFAKRRIKEYQRGFKKSTLHYHYLFVEEYFVSSSVEKQNRSEFPYHQLEHMKETKRYIILKDRGMYAFHILDKSGFAIGNADQFRHFICKKTDLPLHGST